MSTTVSKIQGRSADFVIVDDLANSASSYDVRHGLRSPALADYTLRRLGKKDYAFFDVASGNWGGERMVARYKCSHLEARRRFTVLLITRRLTA